MSNTPNVTCPNGGQFYACNGGSRFVGCCGVDPCGLNGCAAGNLVATSFDPAQYGTPALPDQQCSSGSFYTCAYTDPPFWGCCSTSACAGSGCPAEGLAAAFLSNNPATAEPFLQLNETYDGSSAASPSASAAPQPESHSNTGAIAGGTVGGIVVIAGLVLGLLWLRRRRNRRVSGSHAETSGEGARGQPPQSETVEMEAATPKWASSAPSSPHTPWLTPPPVYGFEERAAKHVSYEMPATESVAQEADSKQVYSPNTK